jgi:mono/diheme cytochrome c family protein
MWKTLWVMAAVASLGVLPAVIDANAGQTERPAAKSSARPSPSQTKAEAVTKTEGLAKAKKLYEMDCAICHGDNGNGQTDVAKSMSLTIPDWTDPKTLADMSDKDIFDIIRNGKDKMPAEGVARAKDDEIRDLVNYVRVLAKAGPAPTSAPAPTPAPASTQSPN